MMNFPLSLSEVSMWLAAMTLILLVTSELLYSLPEYSSRVVIDKRLLRLVALGCGIGFLIIIALLYS
jgi:hypothetical protein